MIAEASNKFLPNFALLTKLYEIVWEILHVYYDECQETPGTDFSRRKQWSEAGNLLSRCFKTTNWSKASGRVSKRENVVFVILV